MIKNFIVPLLPHSGSHQQIQQTIKKSNENTVVLPTNMYKGVATGPASPALAGPIFGHC